MGARRRARECALQALYSGDLADLEVDEALVGALSFCEPPLADEAREFAALLVRGVFAHREELDERIQGSSHNWRLARMAAVDRNVLRFAAFELLHCSEVPRKVTLNEAIEVGKRFGSEDSGAFINGVLDRIARATKKA